MASSVQIKYHAKGPETDPKETPVFFIGQAKNLAKIRYADVKHKLGERVTEQDWDEGLKDISISSDPCSLFSNRAVLITLPSSCSRHNAPSRAHAITRSVKSHSASDRSENVVIVCNPADVYASGCAVARAYSLYSKKTTSPLAAADKATVADKAAAAGNGRKEKKVVNVEFICPGEDEVLTEADMAVLEHAKDGIQRAARIVDTPCNEMHTDAFIQEVKDVAKSLDGLVNPPLVIQGEELDKKGFGGIYGVGKAALHQPALVVLSHEPKGATETIAWVGKGIVYDTGGLSIKGKTAMPGMKRDCGGAAGILGAFYAAVKQGFAQNLHAIFCLAENAVGDRATRPDDIHTLYSGRTVEINNTDAEGRLVVSDGVVYARKDLKADVILDMCTLTGAQGISTGRFHAAHLANQAGWEAKTARAGRVSGDLSFPLVYCPELHFPEFTSAVADMKNSVADRSNAQPSCAGLFINAHLGFDYPGAWIHVDMAGPVHNGERATGYGVALLNTLFGEHVDSNIVKYAISAGTGGASAENGGASMTDGSEEQGNAKKMRLQ